MQRHLQYDGRLETLTDLDSQGLKALPELGFEGPSRFLNEASLKCPKP